MSLITDIYAREVKPNSGSGLTELDDLGLWFHQELALEL